MTLILSVIGLGIIAGILWFSRKGGRDAQRAKVAERALEKATDAARPITDLERERIVRKYKRP